MTTVNLTTTNDYWEAVREHVAHDDFGGGPSVDTYGSLNRRQGGDFGINVDRHELTSRYSWTVTDPATVEFVRSMTSLPWMIR